MLHTQLAVEQPDPLLIAVNNETFIAHRHENDVNHFRNESIALSARPRQQRDEVRRVALEAHARGDIPRESPDVSVMNSNVTLYSRTLRVGLVVGGVSAHQQCTPDLVL